jgi:hypothetical protein
MANGNDLMERFRVEDLHQILCHQTIRECLRVKRLVRASESQHVRNQDAVAKWLEVGNLLMPIIGCGRESVRKDDCWLALLGRAVVIVVFDAAGCLVILVQRGIHRSGVRRLVPDKTRGETQVALECHLRYMLNRLVSAFQGFFQRPP